MSRTKYAINDKKQYIKDYLLSGQNKTEFCKQHQISYSAFYRWLNLYGKEVAEELGLSAVDIAKRNNPNATALTSEQKFLVVLETHNLDDLARGEYCRQNDVLGAQLARWRENCMVANEEITQPYNLTIPVHHTKHT